MKSLGKKLFQFTFPLEAYPFNCWRQSIAFRSLQQKKITHFSLFPSVTVQGLLGEH